MPEAIWNNQVIVESDDTVIVENNHYFPREALKEEFFKDSDHSTRCPWKGVARYLTITINGKENVNCAWFYPDPKPEAENIRGRVAFWRGVEVT